MLNCQNIELLFDDVDASYVGLFGGNCGTIKNVGVVDSYFCGSNYVGGVCGGIQVESNFTATITNWYYNSEKYTGNAVGDNNGTVTKVEGKTTEQFKSGEVAYLLSQGTECSVWGQQLGTDDYMCSATIR